MYDIEAANGGDAPYFLGIGAISLFRSPASHSSQSCTDAVSAISHVILLWLPSLDCRSKLYIMPIGWLSQHFKPVRQQFHDQSSSFPTSLPSWSSNGTALIGFQTFNDHVQEVRSVAHPREMLHGECESGGILNASATGLCQKWWSGYANW